MLPQAIEIDEETTKVVSGTLESLSQDEGSVTLAAASEESISEQNPVVMNFTLSDASTKDAIAEVDKIMIKEPVADLTAGTDDTNITSGTIEYTYLDENNEERTASAEFTAPVAAKAARVARASGEAEEEVLFSASAVTAERDENGSLIINLGTQVAIKRVTIKITGTKKTEPLVEIASVKFVNEMEGRIPAPQLDTPAIQSVETGDKELTVTWDAKNNVTGYELYVEGIVDGGSNASQTIPVDGTQQNIVSINGKDLKNFAVYTIKVRAVNEDWTSPWSDVVTASPKPDKIPDGPDNVKAEGGYRSIKVSWKDMDDSNGYMVYYKEKDGETFIPVVDGFTEVQDGTGRIRYGKRCR
jgi:hypothetical protein